MLFYSRGMVKLYLSVRCNAQNLQQSMAVLMVLDASTLASAVCCYKCLQLFICIAQCAQPYNALALFDKAVGRGIGGHSGFDSSAAPGMLISHLLYQPY